MEIKVIKETKTTQTGSFKVKSSFVKSNNEPVAKTIDSNLEFKVGARVKHKEEGIIGKIQFVGSKIAIVWDDNTRERMDLEEANQNLEYVDDIQSEVAPLTPQMSNNEQVSALLDKALTALGNDEDYDDINDLTIKNDAQQETLDVEKIALQRKINELESKLTSKKTASMKEKIAKELVDVAVMKTMIDSDDAEIEMQKIIMMNDDEFENYKQSVLEFSSDHQVTSEVEEENEELTEAERALKKLKGGKGIIGDFSGEKPITREISLSDDSKRSLSDLGKNQTITFGNHTQIKAPDFSDQFESILAAKMGNKQQREQQIEAKLEKPKYAFENVQGLTKPIQISSKPTPYTSSIKDLFKSLDWTILSK